jgi:hypothetical protein
VTSPVQLVSVIHVAVDEGRDFMVKGFPGVLQ